MHNIYAMDWDQPDHGYSWARRFDEDSREVLQSNQPTEIAGLDGHPDFWSAVPTPDHYLSLLYIAGLADDEPMSLLVEGLEAGSVSMASYTVGLNGQSNRPS